MVGKDTEKSFYPKAFSSYNSSQKAWLATTGVVGPSQGLSSPGVTFIFDTAELDEGDINIQITSMGCKTSKTGAHTNAHYHMEIIN